MTTTPDTQALRAQYATYRAEAMRRWNLPKSTFDFFVERQAESLAHWSGWGEAMDRSVDERGIATGPQGEGDMRAIEDAYAITPQTWVDAARELASRGVQHLE